MAITGIDTIDGKQIIAAGAVSAKSAEMAYNDENGNPITGYLTAVPEGYATTGDLTAYQTTADMTGYQSAGDYLSANALDDVSGDWNRISALTGYSADGWNIKTTGSQRQIVASPIAFTASGISPITGYLTVSSTPRRWCTITDGAIYMYNTARGDSAQFIRPDTILKWNNYASGKLNTTASANFYTTANESGFISEVPAGTMNESAFGYDSDNKISSYNGSAIGGSAPTYDYTDNDLISAIDTSGLYATSALEAKSANALINGGRLGYDVYAVTGAGTNSMTLMILNPQTTPFGNTSGIYSPLYYAQGACMTYGSSAGNTQYFGGFFKGNEWYISNATAGQALRGETHASRGVHLSGATTAGYGFDLNISGVSGVNSNGSWKYGHAEDAALRAVSSCDMHESAFGYDANDKISGYNGSAFAGGSDVPEGVMVESGLEYNAVQEISGYNGSAIAQYGAEKQWLQHDDTLVHASNSAQYALGVNISAVAQLLGEYPISITESGSYTLNSTYVSGTSYLYWYYLSNGMCRIKGQLRPTTAMPATWHAVQIASNGASALIDNTYIPTLIDWEGWVDYLSWFSDGTMNFNCREVSPTAASRLIYVDYLGIPKR